jgi:hypothetical protein
LRDLELRYLELTFPDLNQGTWGVKEMTIQEERDNLAKMIAEAKRNKDIANAQNEFRCRPENGNAKSVKQKVKHFLPTYKYSKLGKGDLYESLILGGIPSFIRYDEKNNKLVPHQQIEEETRILRLPNTEEYPYTPYEFENLEELCLYVEYAKEQTIDSLYRRALDFIKKYNDQDEHKQILLAVDVVWSYLQDKFGTTHYLGIVGDNNSGKSSIGNTFEVLGYRVVNMTSPTAPNIFGILGPVEPGQCSLVLDEADKIDESIDMMMNILKSGNDFTKRVQKTNTNSWKHLISPFDIMI